MIDEYISFRAKFDPDRLAVSTPNRRLNFAEFDSSINRFARGLVEVGIHQHDNACIYLKSDVDSWIATLALSRLRVTSCAIADHHTTFVIGDWKLDRVNARSFHVSAEWLHNLTNLSDAPLNADRSAAASIARIQTSSGTTGIPKRVGWSAHMVNKYVREVASNYGLIRDGIHIIEPHLSTITGFILPLAIWSVGECVYFREQMTLGETVSRMPISFLMLVPYQLQDLLDALPSSFLSELVMRIVVTGGILPSNLLNRACDRISKDIVTVYGATECGSAAMSKAVWLEQTSGLAGYPVPGVSIEIVDDEDRLLPSGQQGHIRIRSDRVVGSYLENSPDTGAFREGCFYPGDIGRVSSQGFLFIDGRVDDRMNIGGSKIFPSFFENKASAYEGFLDYAFFPVRNEDGSDECWMAYVLRDSAKKIEMMNFISQTFRYAGYMRIMSVKTIPRNGMGKVERRRLVEAALRIKAHDAGS